MKKLVTVTEVEGEGLEALLGERVLLLCMNYLYEGVPAGVNSDVAQLDDPHIVYSWSWSSGSISWSMSWSR